MLKKQYLKLFCLLFAISELLIFTAFGLFGDNLFFNSDIVSSFVLAMGLSCCIFGFVALICILLIMLFKPLRANMVKYASDVLEVLIVGCFVFFLFNSLDPNFVMLGDFSRQVYSHLDVFSLDFLWVAVWLIIFHAIYRRIPTNRMGTAFNKQNRLMELSVLLIIIALLYALSGLCSYIIAGLFYSNIFRLNNLADILILIIVIPSVFIILSIIIYCVLLIFSTRFRDKSFINRNKLFMSIILSSILSFIAAIAESKLKYVAILSNIPAKYLSGVSRLNFFLIIWAVTILLTHIMLTRLFFKKKNNNEFSLRLVSKISLVATPVFLFMFIFLVGFNKLGSLSQDNIGMDKRQHVVLIVLDAWPSQFMPLFNDQKVGSSDDLFLDSGLVFRNVHTNSVWTNAYFGTLYSGIPNNMPLTMFGPHNNLFSVLQENGVKVRSYFSHRNGFPEASASRIVDYKGFRSFFASSLFVPFLDALGLEYALIIGGIDIETKEKDPRLKIASKFLPSPINYNNEGLQTFLLREIQNLNNSTKKSFLIFHVGWPVFSSEKHIPMVFGEANSIDTAKKMIDKIRISQDDHYYAEDLEYVNQLRYEVDLKMKDIVKNINSFIETAQKKQLMKNTLVIFTADHGAIYSNGRLWYGHHPQEEVTSVPVIAFGLDRTGIDERSFETIDLTKTITDYFGINIQFHPRARSMFKSGEKPFNICLTLRSDKHKEWFVVIYKGGKKYLFNIHPQGMGDSLEQIFINRFNTKTIETGPNVINGLMPELKQAFTDYGLNILPEKSIHSKYREFLNKN